jgi:hypothetical protein
MTKGIIDRVSAQCAARIDALRFVIWHPVDDPFFSHGPDHILFLLNERVAEVQLPLYNYLFSGYIVQLAGTFP